MLGGEEGGGKRKEKKEKNKTLVLLLLLLLSLERSITPNVQASLPAEEARSQTMRRPLRIHIQRDACWWPRTDSAIESLRARDQHVNRVIEVPQSVGRKPGWPSMGPKKKYIKNIIKTYRQQRVGR